MRHFSRFLRVGLLALCLCALFTVTAGADTPTTITFRDGEALLLETDTADAGSLTAPQYNPASGVLVCWQAQVNGVTVRLAADTQYTFAAGTVATFEPVIIQMATDVVPTARFSEDGVGLRFTTKLLFGDWVALTEMGYTVERGTLIIPQRYFIDIGRTLTHANLENHGKQYLDVKTDGWYYAPGAAEAARPEDEAVFAGSVSNIRFKSHAMTYTAIGYLKLTLGEESFYVYAKTSTGKAFSYSPYQLAYAALTDTKPAAEGAYIYPRNGAFCRYTETEQRFFEVFTASVISLAQDNNLPGGKTLDLNGPSLGGRNYVQQIVKEGDANWQTYLQMVGIKYTGALVITLADGTPLTAENVAGVVINLNNFTGVSMTYVVGNGCVLVAYSDYTDNY